MALVGRAEEITDADDIARLARQWRVLWRCGETARWVRIVPDTVTGRRIYANVR